ncbi:MAG: hypothetical protein BGO29_00175 [Bacteroidales bacterium 36-12]|jgi:hypothetical protein|nr:MAG: hypothetical protein BGO29_00175 [Bacteroidales bacterium 36-12]
MKKVIILTSFILASVIAFAQNNYEEVVYLKNGKTIRGVIIEQVPNVQIKIETADGDIGIFQMEEIQRITKEKIQITEKQVKQPVAPQQEQTPTSQQILEYLKQNNLVIVHKKDYKPKYPYLFSLQSGLAHSLIDLSEMQQNYTQYYELTSEEVNKYISKIKNGFFLNAGFHYLTTNFLGIGAEYNFFRSAAKGEFLVNPNYGYGSSSLPVYILMNSNEKMYLNFIAPSVMFLQYLGENKKICLTESLAPGALFMRMEGRSIDYHAYGGNNNNHVGSPPMYYAPSGSVVTSANFSAKIALSLDYYITPNWSTGLTGNFIWANIKKIRYKSKQSEDSSTLDEPLEFSHLDYGFVIRYNF